MTEPRFESGSLFQFAEHIDRDELAANPELSTLLVTLGAYGDAGHAQRLLNEHILNALPNHEVGRFDADALHDYTGRRPPIVFERDHYESYQTPQIVLHQVNDANGRPFLLLTGPEPSLRWERMAASIEALNDMLGVSLTVLAQGVPAPAPHTRPVWVNAYASKPELLEGVNTLPAAFQMQASFHSMLAVRLGEAGHDVIGLVAHVPQYLADIEYPDATIALVEALSDQTDLDIPIGALPKAAALAKALIEPQVAQSEELRATVESLEEAYEAFMSERPLPSGTEIPSAEQIGGEVEAFLRDVKENPDKENPDSGDDSDGSDAPKTS